MMHITKFSPPNIPTVKIIPTTRAKKARIVAVRMDEKSIENDMIFPSIDEAAYTVLSEGLSIVYFGPNPAINPAYVSFHSLKCIAQLFHPS